jgi:hypothetical protein
MKKVEDFILPAAILVNRYSGEYPDNEYLASDVLKVAEALEAEYAERADLKPFRRPHIELIQEGKYWAKIGEKTAKIQILEQETDYPIEATTWTVFGDGYARSQILHFSYEGKCLENPKISLMVKNAAYEDE